MGSLKDKIMLALKEKKAKSLVDVERILTEIEDDLNADAIHDLAQSLVDDIEKERIDALDIYIRLSKVLK